MTQAFGEFLAAQRYSDEEHTRFSRVIREFNALYYAMGVQTWRNTKYRGIPIWKYPTDLWVYQELIEVIRPDLIIETGTNYGSSALFLRDMLNLIHSVGWVISVDIDASVRDNRANQGGIKFLEGSSISSEVLNQVKAHIYAYNCKTVMVILDSCHDKEHVVRELELYAPLVTVGSILIVEDTNTGGPLDAVREWLPNHPEFQKDLMCEKFMLTVSRDGFLEKVK